MSGWAPPSSPPGAGKAPVGWAAPDDTPGQGTGALIRGSWRLYRSAAPRLLAIAAILEIVRAVLTLPGVALSVILFQGMIRMFGDLSRMRTDPAGFQAEFQAALRPPADLALFAALTGGIGVAVLVIGWAALTAAALGETEGRPIGVAGAFRRVWARRTALVLPAIAAGVVVAALSGTSLLIQPTGAASLSASQAALGSLVGLLILVLAIGSVALAIYWSLALPAILAEDLGLRRGLARGAALTRGIRVRLGLALVVVWLLQGATVSIVAAVVAVICAAITRTLEAAVFGYIAILLVGAFLWAPFLPTVLALAYRDRTAPDPATGSGDAGATATEAEPARQSDGMAGLADGD